MVINLDHPTYTVPTHRRCSLLGLNILISFGNKPIEYCHVEVSWRRAITEPQMPAQCNAEISTIAWHHCKLTSLSGLRTQLSVEGPRDCSPFYTTNGSHREQPDGSNREQPNNREQHGLLFRLLPLHSVEVP
jgi:hypothetical protein